MLPRRLNESMGISKDKEESKELVSIDLDIIKTKDMTKLKKKTAEFYTDCGFNSVSLLFVA